MKFLVALCLLAVAFASQDWEIRPEQIRDQIFKTGKQYNFKFDGQIASGLPISSSPDNSASRIESLVSLNFENDRQVLFKINKIRIGSAQREVESREVQPFRFFEETELTEEQKENLLLPVRFRYENGLISEIEFDREEPTWSANIKRAILNMLQLNLSKKSRSDKEDRLMRDSEEKEWETSTFFSTHEKTLEGDCETSYTVVPSGEETLRVSKSINFEKCKKRVDIRYNLRFGEDCPTCASKFNREEPNTISSTVFEFELNGNAKENLIREVRLRSQYVFTPLDGEKQLMGTYVTNKLTLLSVESGVETIRGPKSEKKEELVYSTEWEEKMEKFRMTGDASLLKKSPFQWMEKKMEMAEKFLTSLRHSIESADKDESIKSETVHDMARLIEVLRFMTTHEIEKLEKHIKKDEKMTSIFYDCLSQAGTFPTVSRLVEGIISRRLSTFETTKSLKRLLDVRTPSDKMIHELLRLTKQEDIIRSPVVRQSLWLSIGAVMNGVCGETQERFAINREEMCTREQKEVYTREMEKLFSDSETHYDKVLALKVFANSGLDLIVFPLEKIIKDRREEESVRLSAVEALRKLRNVMPRKVQNILLPLYKKTSESVEMRIAAFHHLMHTLPSRNIIDQITLQLENEPSTRVFSYVFTTLKSFASSELPCEKDLSRDIEYSLRHVRRQSSRLVDSRSIVNSYYSKEFLSGAELIWSHIASNTSIIPSEVSASLSTLMGGEWYSHMAEIGFSQENIHVLIEKLYELVKKNQNSIEEILVRGKRSSEMRPLEILKDLMKKMGIQERRTHSKHSAAVLYMRIKDMDYVFLPLDEKIIVEAIKEFIKNGASEISSIEKILSRGYTVSGMIGSLVYEKTRIIATTFGMPLDITWKMPTLLSVDGVVKGSIEKRSLSLSVSPKLATTHVIHAECRSPIFSQGVKLIHSLTLLIPIDMDMKLESESRSVFSFNFRLPETESVRVMRMQTRPVTYIRHENKKEEKFDHAIEKTIYLNNPSRKEISRVYGEEILGCRFAVRGNIHRGLFDKMENGVSPVFIGENDIEMRMEKTEKTPREYSARLSFDSIDKKMKMTEDIELDTFYPSEHSHFSVHSDESVEESRRTEFKEYLRTLSSSPVFTHRIHLSLEAIGSTKERRASGELRSMCDESLSYCKWTASMIRSPLLKGENRDWELKSTLETLLPSRMVSVEEMKEQKHREVLARLSTKWGSDEKKTVTLRAQMDQSPEHIKLIERLLEKKNIDSVEQATRLNQIKISADYHLPLETITQFSRLSTLVKGLYPLEFEIETRDEKVEKEGRLLAKLTVEPQTWRYANFSVETPRETLRLKTIRLPFRPTWFSLAKKASIVRTFSPICEVSDSRMKTFDEIIYRAPLTTCYSVLAKDCSEEPKFAVLLKKISKNGEEKKLKMITRENTIEMEMKRDEMEVIVDGKIIKEKKMNEFGLEKRGDVVIFENEDLFVKFDGFKAEIKMNEMYKAKQCGLCGHFDGEKKGEFRKADDEETEDLEEFHRSFLLKNKECEMEESRIKDKKNYKKFDYESESEESKEFEYETEKNEKKEKKEKRFEMEDEESVEPMEKTRVIEKAHRLCFSKTPVPECPKKSFEKEEETKDIKVHFTCLDRSSSEAHRLLRESRRDILSLDDFPVSFVETLTVPKTCFVF
ncbi:hypothetical protein PRIPAC_95959 [Pristionchus pacificus]|uniref:Uncharacterized protein n=1 Tax=Pristionchus pacificus TaxID=54126 RepID=A0A2A6BJQ7_PRIPA|nr:hypothetical protein PRIPAC_95959 [Pristionchus pacificus]|eukprot:PDM66056.1 hypothetical protein PRIPAC_45281 [Pristionchus pacificus]